MFIHNFKYAIKNLFGNKMLIFWTFAFPIILGTFFSLAFSSIEDNEKLDIIDIAIVNNKEFKNDEIMKTTFKELSNKNNKDRLFNTKYVSLKKAKKLLSDNKVSGYLFIEDNNPKIVVLKSGIDQTILKYTVDQINQTKEIIPNLINKEVEKSPINKVDYEKIYNDVNKLVSKDTSKITDISKSNLSYTMIEFYTLIALTCLYGGMISMYIINMSLANMSMQGRRIQISPIKKSKIILSNLLASYIVQLLGLLLLFLYTIFILHVDYGDNIILIIILSLVGTLAGLSLGVAVSTLLKKNEATKTGIIISITMLGSFLSGMMGITMKYIIDKNIPIINKLNPASMITDGFYSLYYYDGIERYLFNIISLLIFSSILIIISCISLRRQKYDSI